MEIFVKAKPKSKIEKVEKIDETHFEVWVKEPPVDGKANFAVMKALANYFKIKMSAVALKSGFTSRNKKFDVGI
jgi:uncharacterized protein